jgi:uncharacterized protein with HEPN domain
MYDVNLALEILQQTADALERIKERFLVVATPDFFTASPRGMEKLDSICMLFIVIGESMKNLDKVTQFQLLSQYPSIDWTGVKGFRDIIAHHYFDIDAEQVFWTCTNKLDPLLDTIRIMIDDLQSK